MGPPWLRTPVIWHSSRKPSGYDYSAMTAEQRKMIVTPFLNWYSADWDYARTTVYFFCVAIGLVTLTRWGSMLRPKHPTKRGIIDRAVALASWTVTKQFRIAALGWNSPPVAAIGAISGIFVFIIALMLAMKPYYWPNHAMGHSMPIATRSGWIAIAIMPFMIAFAAKVNFIGLITRTSHERLQVFHRWAALVMFIPSLVHTFPFIVNEMKEGTMSYTWRTSPFYWSGVAALVPQTLLVAGSWGFFRNSYYETFKKFHYLAATIFMAALFLHCNFRLSSWDYFWATLGIWGTSFLVRFGRTLLTPGAATIEALPDRMLHVRITVRRSFRWKPGQHVFVRFFFGSHFATSHPFTIANVCDGTGVVELALRVRDGITLALAEQATKGSKVRVMLDGPHGHASLATDLRKYDRVLLLAGGSGATFTLPLFLDLVAQPNGPRVEFVVVARTRGAFHFVDTALQNVVPSNAEVHKYITREDVDEDDDHKKGSPSSLLAGRPPLRAVISESCSKATRLAIVGGFQVTQPHGLAYHLAACGPEEFAFEIREAVAEKQLQISQGESQLAQVYLHAENYSW
ncbi:hypothetical protein BKA62DRAFT_451264 [Auriculariales sp. MPI-PUGE-AT-0066]|nr:hypothetical protein BKA62DRAFT_451264 [Auriculariales sp. MPI-PUGE-AT-0066]